MIALDLKTGKEVWRTKSADPKDGYSMTGAPLVANGVVIAGVAGAEFGHRGYLEGFDPESGKSLWRTYTIPAKGEPGSETWPGDSASHGGGSTWITGSYDPELDLVFWGPAIPRPGIRSIAWAITFTPTRFSPFNPRPARWCGTIR